jgi:hypothetical protein
MWPGQGAARGPTTPATRRAVCLSGMAACICDALVHLSELACSFWSNRRERKGPSPIEPAMASSSPGSAHAAEAGLCPELACQSCIAEAEELGVRPGQSMATLRAGMVRAWQAAAERKMSKGNVRDSQVGQVLQVLEEHEEHQEHDGADAGTCSPGPPPGLRREEGWWPASISNNKKAIGNFLEKVRNDLNASPDVSIRTINMACIIFEEAGYTLDKLDTTDCQYLPGAGLRVPLVLTREAKRKLLPFDMTGGGKYIWSMWGVHATSVQAAPKILMNGLQPMPVDKGGCGSGAVHLKGGVYDEIQQEKEDMKKWIRMVAKSSHNCCNMVFEAHWLGIRDKMSGGDVRDQAEWVATHGPGEHLHYGNGADGQWLCYPEDLVIHAIWLVNGAYLGSIPTTPDWAS